MLFGCQRYAVATVTLLSAALPVGCSDAPLQPSIATAFVQSTAAIHQPELTGVLRGGLMSSRHLIEDFLFYVWQQPGMGIEFAIDTETGSTSGYAEFHETLAVTVHMKDMRVDSWIMIPYTVVVDATLYYPVLDEDGNPTLAYHRLPLTFNESLNIEAPPPENLRSAIAVRSWLEDVLYQEVQFSFRPPMAMYYRIGENGLPVQSEWAL